MVLIDANGVLRFILNDNIDMAVKVGELIENNKVSIRYEVIAEVIHVLYKVYLMPKIEITDVLKKFLRLPNIKSESINVLTLALEKYAIANIDFVDCILYSFNAIYGYKVFTFDKKLISLLKE